MRYLCAAFGMLLLASSPVRAGCTPQMVVDLQMRGANPQLISQICGGGFGPGPMPAPMSSVCATNFGFCPHQAPFNTPCTCFGPMGAVPGVAR